MASTIYHSLNHIQFKFRDAIFSHFEANPFKYGKLIIYLKSIYD